MSDRPGCQTEPQARRLFVGLPGDTGPGPETVAPQAETDTLSVPPDLRPAIRQALVWREAVAPHRRIVEHVLPDGAVRLWFDLSGAAAEPLVLGPRLEAQTVVVQGGVAGLSLALTPAAARAIVGAPLRDLRAQAVGFTDLWGLEARDLGDRLTGAADLGQLAAALWQGLRQRLHCAGGLSDEGRRTARVAAALARGEGPDKIGLGERRIQQLFVEHLGLSPREHRRLWRWHSLLRRLRMVDRPDWAALAVAQGWYDQAHMLRDFRAFAGVTPTAYRALAVSGPSKTAGRESG